MIRETSMEAVLPLTESTFLILLSLAQGAKHGYAIMKDVKALSGGRVQLSTGTLYGALKRLLSQSWIQRAEVVPDASRPGLPRRAYVLTDMGRRVLGAEVGRLQTLVAAADLRAAEVRS